MKNSKLITVTLNPSLDETVTVNYLNLGYHNLATDTMRLDASGRGVNVSRSLSYLDVKSHALVLLGNDAMGHAYKGLLLEQPFESTIIRHDGHTRSDTIIFDLGNDKETHIIDGGRNVSHQIIDQVINQLQMLVEDGDIVILAGGLPHNLSIESYHMLCETLSKQGAKVMLIAGHEPLDTLKDRDLQLVALTRLETESYFNYPVRTFADMVTCAHKLRKNGTQQVIITNDLFDGAVLVTADEQLMIEMPVETSGTDSGVVDAMISGFVAGLTHGKSTRESFKLGMASMHYSATKLGNFFATFDDLEPIIQQIDVQTFDPELKI